MLLFMDLVKTMSKSFKHIKRKSQGFGWGINQVKNPTRSCSELPRVLRRLKVIALEKEY